MRSTTLLMRMGLAVIVAGIGSSALLAQHGGHGGPGGDVPAFPSAPSVRTGKITGKVTAIDQTSITVETQRKGWIEETTYLLDGHTKIKGAPKAGFDVVVKYREERERRTATSVEVKKAKQAAKTGA